MIYIRRVIAFFFHLLLRVVCLFFIWICQCFSGFSRPKVCCHSTPAQKKALTRGRLILMTTSYWSIRVLFRWRFVWKFFLLFCLDAFCRLKCTAYVGNRLQIQRDFTSFLVTRREMMDNTMKQLLRRLIRRIPAQALPSTLAKWGRLTAAQRESIDFTQPKWTLAEKLLDICEVCFDFVFQKEHRNS